MHTWGPYWYGTLKCKITSIKYSCHIPVFPGWSRIYEMIFERVPGVFLCKIISRSRFLKLYGCIIPTFSVYFLEGEGKCERGTQLCNVGACVFTISVTEWKAWPFASNLGLKWECRWDNTSGCTDLKMLRPDTLVKVMQSCLKVHWAKEVAFRAA